MADWIPFLQSLIWPVLIVVFLLLTRDWVIAMLDAILARIRKGDPFQAGPFSMGQSIPQDAYSPTDIPEKKDETSISGDPFSYGNPPEMPQDVRKVRAIRLIHTIGPWGKDKDGYTRRDVVVTLETIPDSLLEKINKVTYYLPDSWPKKLRVQEKRDRSSNFFFKTRAYGEVTVGAKVEFNDGTPAVVINRYCNFYDEQI